MNGAAAVTWVLFGVTHVEFTSVVRDIARRFGIDPRFGFNRGGGVRP